MEEVKEPYDEVPEKRNSYAEAGFGLSTICYNPAFRGYYKDVDILFAACNKDLYFTTKNRYEKLSSLFYDTRTASL